MGGIKNYTAAGFLSNQGKEGASAYQSQYDAMNPGARPEDIKRESRLGKDKLMEEVYKLKGPEAWQKAALAKAGEEEVAMRDLAATQSAGAAAGARSAMASRAGLTGGAAERLAKSQMLGQLSSQQNAARQAVQSRADIGLESENKRSGVEKYNIEAALGERNAQDQFAMQKYQSDMQEWAAAKQAQATFAAGKGKGQSGGVMGGVGKVMGK